MVGNPGRVVDATGGLTMGGPAAELAMSLAIGASVGDTGMDPEMVAVGEVGLSGELRAVSELERRLSEAARLGFRRALVPKVGAKISAPEGIELIPVSTLREAIKVGLVKKSPREA